MLYLLDTDTASYLVKGLAPRVEEKLRGLSPSSVAISVMTRAELQYGLKRLPASHRLHLVVSQFLKIAYTLAWEADAADWYATIRHQLTLSGKPIGDMDMKIAAHALALGATLVTNNTRHFKQIDAPLLLENWMSAE